MYTACGVIMSSTAENDLHLIDDIVKQCTTNSLDEISSDEIVAALKPKAKRGDKKVEYEDVMIKVKDVFTFLIPIIQKAIRASNKEMIERQDQKEKALNDKIAEVEKKANDTIESLRTELTNVRYQLDGHQQWSRRENLRIIGIKKTVSSNEKEDCVQIASNIFADMGVPVEKDAISAAHRLNTRDSDKIGAIIVRFVSRAERLRVIRKKKSLMEKSECQRKYPNAFIIDDTTPLRSSILYKLRHDKTNIKSSWSIDGRIYVRKTGETDSDKPHVINDPGDLIEKLKWSKKVVDELMVFKD